ncbi:TPR domain-containing protein [Naegleria gruberi]|uniref:TPR domain-containing protein n=1 Tax=Naegleria gruberi TaxID=5762 RepID=D2VUJ4_NAEGR|nr:TPR domain-containing protein [Naegleria gruberi]EFC39461.1 TPR domain-containing protein [Naegleria gruberi]|eukprot:XP_002672205.1 TPR domain-containing protein [Naegleria gruberi strain NEG-M]
MCHGCYAPPLFLLPVLLVVEAFRGIGKGIQSVDQAIRANNLKMIELFKQKKHDLDLSASNQLLDKSSVSIQEIKKHVDELNDNDREQLAKLLIQRCIARLEQPDYGLAKDDMLEALSLMNATGESGNDGSSSFGSFCRNFYLAEYLLGMCYHGNGDFKEAAIHFQKSIEHRSYVESQLIDHQDNEKELIAMEEQFFSMQLEAKKPVEKVAASWTKNWSYYANSVTNFTNKAKNFYNHNLMLGSDKPVLKTKPNTYITLELLYIRAGVSYYSGTYYANGVEYFNRAIELGESYQSEYLESSYYNRGLCYYYLGELETAIEDFTKSISLMPLLKQRDAVYLMRAATYGRLGMIKEKEQDEYKARLINPFGKPLPLFHLRLLDDDTLCHIMSFLQTRQVLVMSSLNKYSRNLVKSYLQQYDIEISYSALVVTEKKPASLGQTWFLPKESLPGKAEMVNHVLQHSLLKHVRNMRLLACSSHFFTEIHFEEQVLSKTKNLKRLALYEYTPVQSILPVHSPDLEYLEIGSSIYNDYHFRPFISKFTNLKHLKLGVAFFPSLNPFSDNPNLQIVEYLPITDQDTEYYVNYTGSKPVGNTWEELKSLNPHIVFKEYQASTSSCLYDFTSY